MGTIEANPPIPESAELPSISRFTPEAKEGLERKGFLVYTLMGKSIASLREAGLKFWNLWDTSELLDQVPSIRSEVAMDPVNFYLPGSNFKSLDNQKAQIAEYASEISKQVPGVTAIMGSVPDYAELAILHLAATGFRPELYTGPYNGTTTHRDIFNIVISRGIYHDSVGLCFQHEPILSAFGESFVWAAPLIVPSRKKI